MQDPPRLQAQDLPNNALRARIPLRPAPLYDRVPVSHQRWARGDTAPALSLERPLGWVVTIGALVWVAASWNDPTAWDFMPGPKGSGSSVGVPLLALLMVALLSVYWRVLHHLGRPQDLCLAVGKGQLLIWRDGSRTVEVDAPLEQCQLRVVRNELTVLVGDEGAHAWTFIGSSDDLRALLTRIEAIAADFGSASEVPEQLKALRQPATGGATRR